MKLLLSLTLVGVSFAVNAQNNPPSKVTVIKRTTDASGKTKETREVKTGTEAANFHSSHPEINAAANTEMHTSRVTIIRRTIDPITGKKREERIVKEGADAENFDWREAGYNPIEKTGMAEVPKTIPTPDEKPALKANDLNSEDISIEIDNTTDAQNRAYLGVSSSEMPSNKGVVVDFVLKDSPAALAGLTEWDIITAVNGISIHNSIELQKTLEPFEPNDKIKIDYIRNSVPKTVVVTLADSGNMEDKENNSAEKAHEKAVTSKTEPSTDKAPKTAMENGTSLMGTMKNVPLKNFRIYPNPSGSGLFTIQFNTTPQDYILLKVLDTNGRSEVFTRQVNGIESDYTFQVDLQHKDMGDFTLVLVHNTVEYRETLHYQR